MRRASWLVVAAVTLLAGGVRADIYEWTDPSGARHFTNSKQGVPAEYQDTARVFLADWTRPAAPAAPPAASAPLAPVAPVVGESGGWNEANGGPPIVVELAGVGGGGGGTGGGNLEINSPLAIVSTRTSEDYGGVPYGFYPPWPWYEPFVTTSFDRGRSRHQTLRMLLQDQFQLDRDGPYGYQRWDAPGRGPALAPFLPRGLPFGVQQYGRVIYR